MPELSEYRRKRRFGDTPEPRGKKARKDEKIFVIQKHAARRLHYDLRLEVGEVLKSWAVPKGPSLNPGDKRLAVQVEDHPFDYRTFEGTIPEGNYGAGEVIIWDQGTYEPEGSLSTAEQLERGELKFRLYGYKLNGSFVLVKLKHSRGKNEWLLIKHRDEDADPMWDVEEHGESVVSGRPIPKTQKEKKRASQESAPPNPAELPGAHSAPIPREVSVTLAKIADKVFSDPNWLFEIKWDGIRTVAFVENGGVRLFSRSKRDVTAEFPEFQDLAKHLRAGTAILDGEIVTLDENGRSDFQKLQNRFGVTKPSQKLISDVPLTYYFFDVLYCNGFDVRKTPLLQRKEFLRQLLSGDDRVRFSEHQLEKGKELYAAAKAQGLEGIVGKQIESPYTGNRTGFWLNSKSYALRVHPCEILPSYASTWNGSGPPWSPESNLRIGPKKIICERRFSWAFVKIARRTTARSPPPVRTRPPASRPHRLQRRNQKSKRARRHPTRRNLAPRNPDLRNWLTVSQKAFASWWTAEPSPSPT